MDRQAEQLLRDAAASLCSDWLTASPFQMSELRVEKVGFAEIPVAVRHGGLPTDCDCGDGAGGSAIHLP